MKKYILSLLILISGLSYGQVIVSSLSPTNYTNTLGYSQNYNRTSLKSFDAQMSKIQNGVSSTTASVVWLGDSWVAGSYFVAPLSSYLRNKFGDAGCGYYGAGSGNTGNSFGSNNQNVTRTKVGNWTNKVGTTYVRSMGISLDSTSTVGDSIYYVGVMTNAVVHYMVKASGGSFVTRIDGTTPTTVTTAGTTSLSFSSISGLTEGTHTLSIKVASEGSGVLICGAEINRNNKGVRVHNLGCSGTTSGQWLNQDSAAWSGGLQQLAPNTVIITLGTNDCIQNVAVSTYTSNIKRIVNRVKAAMPLADIVLFSQTDVSTATTYPQINYVNALKAFALTNGYCFIDNYSLFGSYTNANSRGLYTDAVHPSVSGGNLIKLNFSDFLMNGLPMYYDWNTNFNIGKNSLLSAVASGTYNTALGVNSMSNTTTGSQNTAVGYNTLLANTTGSNNVAIGNGALVANTSGYSNTGIGFGSLNANTTGNSNSAFGQAALQNNTNGTQNTAVGWQAMKNTTSATANTALGYNALVVNTGSTFNNVAVGAGALSTNTAGNNNTAIGYFAGGNASITGGSNIFIGNFAGYRESGSNIIRFDNQSRADLATERISSIISGTMGASASVQTLVVNAHLTALHVVGNSTAVTTSTGSAVGTGGTASVTANSTDIAGLITVTTGTASTGASAPLAVVTFNRSFTVAPNVILDGGQNAATAALSGNSAVYVSSVSTTAFTLSTGSTTLATSTVYKWGYTVFQ